MKLCPCGCGKALGRYNGQRMLVCYSTWQQVPQEIKAMVMLPFGIREARIGARKVFEIAHARRAERRSASGQSLVETLVGIVFIGALFATACLCLAM